MAEHEGQTGSDGTPAVPDETLRLYLLCRLAEDERLRLDERLLVDHELAERVVLVESELTDDHVAGRLDAVEQEAFTKTFLVTEDRRRHLRFTSALQDYSRSRAASPRPVIMRRPAPSWSERIAGVFSLKRPAWVIAGSFAVLLLLVGVAWLVSMQRRETQSLIAGREPIPTLSPTASPEVLTSPATAKASPQPVPSQRPSESATVTEAAVPPTIASFVLLPGAIRGGGELTRIAVPNGRRDVVRLSLVLETVAEGDYQAELLTAEGQAVTALTKLKVDGRNAEARIVLDIPARLLRNGDYQIKLGRKTDGQNETVARYYFRALE